MQSSRLLGGVLGMRVAGKALDSLGRPASLPLSPVGEIKCLRKLIRSHEMTCGQVLGSSEDLLRWLVHSIKNEVLNGTHCNIIGIVYNL